MPSVSTNINYEDGSGMLLLPPPLIPDKFPDSFKSLKNLWESKSTKTYSINSSSDNCTNRNTTSRRLPNSDPSLMVTMIVAKCHRQSPRQNGSSSQHHNHNTVGPNLPKSQGSKPQIQDAVSAATHRRTANLGAEDRSHYRQPRNSNSSTTFLLTRGHSLDNGRNGHNNHTKKSSSNPPANHHFLTTDEDGLGVDPGIRIIKHRAKPSDDGSELSPNHHPNHLHQQRLSYGGHKEEDLPSTITATTTNSTDSSITSGGGLANTRAHNMSTGGIGSTRYGLGSTASYHPLTGLIGTGAKTAAIGGGLARAEAKAPSYRNGSTRTGQQSYAKTYSAETDYDLANVTKLRYSRSATSSASLPGNNEPMTSKEVLKLFAHYLTPDEHREISSYSDIWYLGKLLGKASDLKARRPLATKAGSKHGTSGTYYYAEDGPKPKTGGGGGYREDTVSAGPEKTFYYGVGFRSASKKATVGVDSTPTSYTDKEGLYKIMVGDHIAYRYEIADVLGQGSFSQVVKAYDHRDSKYVAVKIIRNKKRFHQQALTEIKLLKNLQKSIYAGCADLTVEMMDHFYFRQHLCIVFELLGPSLYDTLKKSNFHGFPLDLVKDITGSLLKCLSTLRKHRIIHCDFKPENILVKPKTKFEIKLIDFGSSCFENEQLYTYIQSRFYRAPEVILGATQYTPAIDIWSLGCVAAELYTGYPLFPGEDEKDQLACFIEVLGLPPKDMSYNCDRWKEFFDSKGNIRTSYKGVTRVPNSKNLSNALKCSDYLFIDFLYKCFRWNPSERLTPNEALAHPWISSIPYNSSHSLSKSTHVDTNPSNGEGKAAYNNRRPPGYTSAGTSVTSDIGDGSSLSSNESSRCYKNYGSSALLGRTGFKNGAKSTQTLPGKMDYTHYKPKVSIIGGYENTRNRYQDLSKQQPSNLMSLSCKLQHLELNGSKSNNPYSIDKKYYISPYTYQTLEK